MDPNLLNKVKKLSQQTIRRYEDDFDASDGGNFDDTYDAGMTDGERSLAEEVIGYLEKFDKLFNQIKLLSINGSPDEKRVCESLLQYL